MLWIYPQTKVNRDSRHKKKPGGDDCIPWAPGGFTSKTIRRIWSTERCVLQPKSLSHGPLPCCSTRNLWKSPSCSGRSITQFDCSIFVGSEVVARSQATGLNFRASPRASVVVETCQVELQVKAVDHSPVPLWKLKGGHVASGYHHGVLTCHLKYCWNMLGWLAFEKFFKP